MNERRPTLRTLALGGLAALIVSAGAMLFGPVPAVAFWPDLSLLNGINGDVELQVNGSTAGITATQNDGTPESRGTINFTALGDVVGPGSATDNAIARWDTTTGKLLQDSLIEIDDPGRFMIPESSAPGGAPADFACLYSVDQNGHTVMEFNDSDNIPLRLGRDQHFVAKIAEAGGVTRGQIVYISGALGANELIKLAQADSLDTIVFPGMAIQTGALNDFVEVSFGGKVAGLNTSAFSVGDHVYVSAATPGAMTATRPTGLNFVQSMGTITRDSATVGEILIFTGGAAEADLIGGAGTDNQLALWDGTDHIDALAAGNNGEVLIMVGGVPAYTATALAVTDIDNPSTELNALDGAATGAWVLCYEVSATQADESTLYQYDISASSHAEVVPYSVDGNAGNSLWISRAGKYTYTQTVNLENDVVIGGVAAIAGTLGVSGVTTTAGRVQNYTEITDADYTVLTTDETVLESVIATGRTLTLPASPTAGQTYLLLAHNNVVATITVGRNGSNINSAASDVVMGLNARADLEFINAAIGWIYHER